MQAQDEAVRRPRLRLLAARFWGWRLGSVGMLLSVPLTITAKIALDARSETK